MTKKVTFGSTKRFGPRYGAKNREKVGKLEHEHRRKHKCPFCSYVKVKRVSSGIWQCEKCNAKFTGKAYTFESKKRKSADLLKKTKEKVIEEDYADMAEIEAMEAEEKTDEQPVEEETKITEDDSSEEEKEVIA